MENQTAPRLTPQYIEDTIDGAIYTTALDIAKSNNMAVSPEMSEKLKCLTICILILKNGFTVTGESACVSPENFDANIGRKIALDDAMDKIWLLEGYLLKQRIYDDNKPVEHL